MTMASEMQQGGQVQRVDAGNARHPELPQRYLAAQQPVVVVERQDKAAQNKEEADDRGSLRR